MAPSLSIRQVPRFNGSHPWSSRGTEAKRWSGPEILSILAPVAFHWLPSLGEHVPSIVCRVVHRVPPFATIRWWPQGPVHETGRHPDLDRREFPDRPGCHVSPRPLRRTGRARSGRYAGQKHSSRIVHTNRNPPPALRRRGDVQLTLRALFAELNPSRCRFNETPTGRTIGKISSMGPPRAQKDPHLVVEPSHSRQIAPRKAVLSTAPMGARNSGLGCDRSAPASSSVFSVLPDDEGLL